MLIIFSIKYTKTLARCTEMSFNNLVFLLAFGASESISYLTTSPFLFSSVLSLMCLISTVFLVDHKLFSRLIVDQKKIAVIENYDEFSSRKEE